MWKSIYFIEKYWKCRPPKGGHLVQFSIYLTHCGLMTPYGDIDLDQHWLRLCLVAWRHQATAWTNFDLLLIKFSDIRLRAITKQMTPPSIAEICLRITFKNNILFKSLKGKAFKYHTYHDGLWCMYAFHAIHTNIYPLGSRFIVFCCGFVLLLLLLAWFNFNPSVAK